MIRVLMCDLGLTLIDAHDRPFPHVAETLASIQHLVASDGKPLGSCLVSDFSMPDPPPTAAKIEVLFQQYLQILDSTGLRPLFEPVGKRVTLSTHAGAMKPAKKVFEKALERLGVHAPLTECLFITENAAHILAARQHLHMQTLQFRVPGQAQFDFDDWSQAPLLIAHLISPSVKANTEVALRAHLRSTRDLELMSAEPSADPGVFQVRAKVWHPVTGPDLGPLNGILVSLPVDGRVTLGPRGEARSVQLTQPPPEHVAEAASFVRSLARNKQVEDQPGGGDRGATHQIEVDAQGRRKLTRKRFTAL